MFEAACLQQAERFLGAARARGLRVATAESCTGGLMAGLLTEIAGASDVFERGFVVYANRAKTELLGVPAELIAAHGAVSPQTARAMAEGALAASPAELALAITGVAGPGGGTPGKPVGLVHFAAARRGGGVTLAQKRFGSLTRQAIRLKAVETGLALLLGML